MKAWAVVAGLVLISALLGYGAHVVRKAARVDAAEARAEAAEKGRAADMAEVVKRLDADAAQRGELIARLDGIDKRFADLRIPEPGKLVLTKEVPGACPSIGVSADFVGVFNAASQP